MDVKEDQELLLEVKKYFETHKKKIGELRKRGKRTVTIGFSDLAAYSLQLGELFVEKPREFISLMKVALEELEWAPYPARFHVDDLPDDFMIQLDNLRGKHIGRLACLEGTIITKGKVRTLSLSTYECSSCGMMLRGGLNKLKCKCNNKTRFKILNKEYSDFREVYINDLNSPESMHIRFADLFIEGDNDSILNEGNVIRISGIIKEKTIDSKSEVTPTMEPLGLRLLKKKTNDIGTIDELLKQLKKRGNKGAFEFEEIVAIVFEKKGYKASVTKKTGDKGIDVIAEKGKEKIAIQCKLNAPNIPLSNAVIQKAMGASRSPYEANKLIVVTTSNRITPMAKEQAKKYSIPVEIWDRKRFMNEYNAHVKDLEEAWDIINKEPEEPSVTEIDIDKIIGNDYTKEIGMNYRDYFSLVRNKIEELEKEYGKIIPKQMLEESLKKELQPEKVNQIIEKLMRSGDIFYPKRGYIQKM